MKIYISADMEGVTGVNAWEEVTRDKMDYDLFRKQMTAEVVAACRGAVKAGVKEIVVKDAHDTGRNILPADLPAEARLIRGWSGHPLGMVQDIDQSFHALIMIGYHSRAYSSGNPLAHTWSSSSITSIRLNGKYMSEYAMFMLAGEYVGVPTVLVSGDQGLADEINSWNAKTKSVVVKQGIGNSTVNIQPDLAVDRIEKSTYQMLSADIAECHVKLPKSFTIEIQYKAHPKAYAATHYPGAFAVDDHTVGFASDDYYEILRFTFFAF